MFGTKEKGKNKKGKSVIALVVACKEQRPYNSEELFFHCFGAGCGQNRKNWGKLVAGKILFFYRKEGAKEGGAKGAKNSWLAEAMDLQIAVMKVFQRILVVCTDKREGLNG